MSTATTEHDRELAALRRRIAALEDARAGLDHAVSSFGEYAYHYELTPDGPRAVWVSPRWHELFGRPAGDGTDFVAAWIGAVHPDDKHICQGAMASLAAGVGVAREMRIVTAAGETRWIWARAQPRRDGEGRAFVDGLISDVSDRQAMLEELSAARAAAERRSATDALTGLANRRRFAEGVLEAFARSAARGSRVGLLYIDVDGFKAINDTLGHAAGDEVLREVAGRIGAAVRADDLVARHGGDEFLVLMADMDGEAEAAVLRAGRHVLAALQAPMRLEGAEHTVRASVGIALHPDHAGDAAALLRAADRAMYAAKARARAGLPAEPVLASVAERAAA